MSHFTVLVVGADVEKQLAPFHEFECTGDDNEYVQDVDQTEEARKEYESDENTTTCYKDFQGTLHSPYDKAGNYDLAYWREPTLDELAKIKAAGNFPNHGDKNGFRWNSTDWHDGKGSRPKVFALPEGWSEVWVPQKQVETFLEFVEDYYSKKAVPFGEKPDLVHKHKYGYALLDEKGEVAKVIDRTNKNKKWDWWEVGGRWTGYFKMKEATVGSLGRPGIQTMDSDYKPPAKDRADIALKCDIDIEGMRDEAGQRAAERYDLFSSITAGCPKHLSWKEIQKLNEKPGEKDKNGESIVDWGAVRDAYGNQPVLKALRESKDKKAHWLTPDDFLCTRDEYIDRERKGALATFAVVKDGKWYERGGMGWWGVVHNEKDDGEWVNQFSVLINDLPGDTLLTVVDCHI